MSDLGNLFLIEGQSIVAEYARNAPEAIVKVYASTSEFEQVQKAFPKFKIHKNENLSKQNCFAQVKIEVKDFDFLLKHVGEKDVVVALDHVQDPRNVGAICRTCAFFGVRFMLVPKDRQAQLTQSSVATAQGDFRRFI